MPQNNMPMIGKPVKDMYGASMGKVLGTTTEIDGTIQSVGINCGSEGLKQIPFQQLVVQPDTVIFIPKWIIVVANTAHVIWKLFLALRNC